LREVQIVGRDSATCVTRVSHFERLGGDGVGVGRDDKRLSRLSERGEERILLDLRARQGC
jgi:hypothetical protein